MKKLVFGIFLLFTGCAKHPPVEVYRELFMVFPSASATIVTVKPELKEGFLIAKTGDGSMIFISSEYIMLAAWGGESIPLLYSKLD